MGLDTSLYTSAGTVDATKGIVTFTPSSSAPAGTPTVEIQYDWMVKNSSGTNTYRKFKTAQQKYQLKVMNALGYALPQNSTVQTSASVSLNAMPLLCFGKAYNDWMSQSQRYNSSSLTTFLRSVKEDKGTTGYNNGSHRVLHDGISIILDSVVLQYENDYFVSA